MTFSLHGNFSDRNFLGVELNKRSCHIYINLNNFLRLSPVYSEFHKIQEMVTYMYLDHLTKCMRETSMWPDDPGG